MHLRRALAIALVFALAGPALAKDRTWTSSDGRTMQGEFVRELDGDVTFLVKGKLVTIALDKLSQRDQQIVRDLAAGKALPEEATTPPATTGASTPAPSKPAEADPFAPVPDRPEVPARSSTLPTKKKQKGPESRVWTDIFGRKATGKFIRIFGSNVVVSRAGGPLTIDYFELSEADQTYVRELLTSRGEEDLIPIKPPPKRDAVEGGTGRSGIGQGSEVGTAESSPDPSTAPIGPGISGPGIGGPGIGGPGIGGPGIGRGGREPRGPSGFGPSGPGSGMSGPRLGPSGPGFGPGSGIGPPTGIGPGSNIASGPGSGPRGPSFPPGIGSSGFGPAGFGPAGSSANAVAPSSPYGPTQSSSPPPTSFAGPTSSSPYGSSPSSFADQQAEQLRRDAERLSQPTPSFGSTFQRVPVCSNCRKQVTEEESKRTTCPHCGARWVYNQYNPSATSRSTSGSSLSSLSATSGQRAVRTTIIVVGAIVVVVVLCGGAIAVALALASASRPAQRYRI